MIKQTWTVFLSYLLVGFANIVKSAENDDYWYLKVGRDISETGLAAGIIEKKLDAVWDKIKDFGNWNFVPGMSTVCAELDKSTGHCVLRNVTMKGIDYAGYKFANEFYQEKQDISKREDNLFSKVIHYERVVGPPFTANFSAKMTFKLSVDYSNPLYTFVEQKGEFKKSQRNIRPLAKELSEAGFLNVINSLRKSFNDLSKFAGHALIELSHIFQEKLPIGGILQVISGDYTFEQEIKHGITTSVKAGFDQIRNGWVTINILSNNIDSNNGGRSVLCTANGQVTILPKIIKFKCDLHVTGRAILPSLMAIGIFEQQLKGVNIFEVLEMSSDAGKELIAYAITSVNEQSNSFVTHGLTKLNALAWDLDFGNFSNMPFHIKQVSHEHYGLNVNHFMELLKGHIDWFIGNFQPTIMQSKALTQPDPWVNFLIPESARLNEALLLSKLWGYDDEFCRQFLQGPNPLEITKVTDWNIIPIQFNKLYNKELDKNKLYYVEYSILNSILNELPKDNLIYPDTFVLFRSVNENIASTSLLEIVGIQLEKNGIIYHKNDGMKWRYLFAKMWTQNAAMQTQEFLWHLGIGHFLPEGLIAPLHNAFATANELTCDDNNLMTCDENNNVILRTHAIYRLLKPHFKYTLGMGSLARLILDGRATRVADVVFAAGHKGVITLINAWYKNYTFNDFTIEKQILNRGIESNDLPKYYYRDDSLKLWNILQKYCKNIVYSTYDNDNNLLLDKQIQLFAKLASENVNGFPNKFNTRDQLAFALANIIATPVILHTATNYAQAPYNYFPVNRPFRLKKKMSDFKQHHDLTPSDINDALPNYIEQFITGMFMHVLTLKPDNSLLDTAIDQSIFADIGDSALEQKLKNVQKMFYDDLIKFSGFITKRDNDAKAKNQLPYPYFQPSDTCTSTNI